jgi:signal transduction histidine kinase
MKQGWLATVLGCGILLALILVFTVTSTREAERIYSELSANDSTIQALEIELAGLRADIYLSGIYVRDQLLDSQSRLAEDQREKLQIVHDSMQERLDRIEQLVPGEQAREIDQLRQEISKYWEFLSPIADEESATFTKALGTVRQQLVERHDSSLAIAQEIGRINREAYDQRHQRIEATQSAFLKYMWTMMTFTLALGVLVFVACGYIVIAVNRRAEVEHGNVERAEKELRRLSSELFAAQEQERRILSRELHDEVGQTLTALGMEIGNIEGFQAASGEELQSHINEARRLTQDTLKTVRSMAMGLRPAMLDDSGLAPALRYQAREFSRRSGISATVEINGNVNQLSDAHRTCVYRVVQEALTNCARHSKATAIRIVLTGGPNSVSLRVEDNGVGITTPRGTGMGLVGISERARELNGTMHIGSAPGGGTVLSIDLPIVTGIAV